MHFILLHFECFCSGDLHIRFIAVDTTALGASASQNPSIGELEQTSTEDFLNENVDDENTDFLQILQGANNMESEETEIPLGGEINSSSLANEESGLTSEETENLLESELSIIGEEDSSEGQSNPSEPYIPNNFTADQQVLTTGAESATSWSFANGNDQIFYIEYSGEICNCWIQLYQDAYNFGQDIILHVDYNQTRDGPNGGGLDLRDYTDSYPNCTEFNWSNQVSSYNIWCYNLN